MESIISQGLIDRYLTKEVKIKGRLFRSIFRYSQDVEDTSEYIVGFKEGDREFTTSVYVPTIDDGMIRRNSNLWYPVHLVVPPVCHTNRYGKAAYLRSIINDSMMCSSASDFMPIVGKDKPQIITRLMKELSEKGPLDASNLYNWNVISLNVALIELFNQKLLFQIKRSMNMSYAGCSGISKAMHTLINAMTRYYGDSDAGMYVDGADIDEEILANSLSRDDKKGVLLIHPMVKQIDISGTNPIDFCSCSQSLPMLTARIKSGVNIEGVNFSGDPDFPYAEYRRAIPGILHDDPHRVVVSRSISRAMVVASESEPYVTTEVDLGLNTVSLPGILMTDPLNMEDAIIVSATFAQQMGAFKILIDKFTFPSKSHEVTLSVDEESPDNIELVAMVASGYYSAADAGIDIESLAKTIVRPKSKIGTIRYIDDSGEVVLKDFVSENKVPAVVTCIDSFHTVSDVRSDMVTYKITYMAYFPLMIGSKVSDLHGNKATVSEILPDIKMPLWEGERVHYIATPYIMKRLAVGAEVEDKLALIGKSRLESTGERLVVNSGKTYPIESLDAVLDKHNLRYCGKVEYNGTTYDNIPRALRMMVRLDNNPDESLVTRSDVIFDDGVRISRNSKLGLDLVTLISRGANNLVNEIIHQSGNRRYFTSSVMPIMNAIANRIPEDAETYEITRRIDRDIIGSPISYSMMNFSETASGLVRRDFTDTVCDPRSETHYGIIKHGDNIFIVPPNRCFVEMTNGLVMVSKISVMANRLLAEVISEQKAGADMANVSGCISRYYNTLSGILSGKNGLIRESLLPVMKRSTRAVISPYIGSSVTEICIPRKEFRKMCLRDKEFKEFYSDKNMCILKRDPVHRNNNVISVTFKLWDRSTIGVHPALIKIIDGDYDGDQCAVSFPSTTLGYNDLHKLSPDMQSWFKGSKQLTDVDYSAVPSALETNRGWTSTFMNPHPSDILKNPELLAILKRGMGRDTASKMCIKAAMDFCTIKDGTALTGALGLRFIFTRPVAEKDRMNGAMELYHSMAQCTLDAKSGSPVPSLDIVSAFSKTSSSGIVRGMRSLGFTDIGTIEDLISFSARAGRYDNIMTFLVDKYPILAATQKKLSYTEMLKLAERCLNNEQFSEGGVMEKLYDYILDRDKVMPFEYNFDIMEVYNHAKFNHPSRGISGDINGHD